MKTTFFVRSAHDAVTSYLFFYSKELVEESNLRGFRTINKKKQDANKLAVTTIIKKENPAFIMFNGHGNSPIICGHDDEILIQQDVNDFLLRNKITYSFTCKSADGIGRNVADSTTTFIGYVEDFALGMDVNSQASVMRDKRAKLFLEPSNLLVKSILKGNAISEAVSKAKKLMKKNISILRTDPFPDSKDYIPYLFHNYLSLEAFGNKEAMLKSN